jgi:hypothetical protein
MFQQGSPYRRKIAQNIPICEWYQAEDYVRNEFGISVYKAANSYAPKGVVAENYYWVDQNKNHIPFPSNEVLIGIGTPTNTPDVNGPFIYLDSSTGSLYTWDGSTWVAIGGGNNNIYNSDGTLTGIRTVNGGGFSLTFNNLTKFFTAGVFGLSSVPATLNTNTSFLTRNSITGEVEIRDISTFPSTDTNFAKDDLTFTGTRNHNLAGFDLIFNAADVIALDTNRTVINAVSDITLNSTAVTLAVAPTLNNTGSTVLVRDTLTGNIQERSANTLTNFTISDGVSTSLISGGDTLLFNESPTTGPLGLSVSGDSVFLTLDTTGFVAGQVLSWNGLQLTNTTPVNIYNANGTLTGNRVLSGANFNLNIQDLTTFVGRADNMVLEGENSFTVITPNVFNNLATAGQVLTLTNAATGLVEFTTPTSSTALIIVRDEGVQLTTQVAEIDFVGAGVTATAVGNNVTVTIPGGSSATPVVEYLPIAVPTSTITAAQPINTNFLATIFRNGVRDNAARLGQTWTFSPSLIIGEIVQIEYYT